jgi:CRP-like cAMP-binding protein
MTNPVTPASSYTTIRLTPGEVLITQGAPGGSLYVLEEGELGVVRDGVEIATVSRPYSVVGEMSVVLGTPTSATVRAVKESRVRVFSDARSTLSSDADFAFRMAYLMASRLDATSALLVEHKRKQGSKPENDIVSRLFNALHLPSDEIPAPPADRQEMFSKPQGAFPR